MSVNVIKGLKFVFIAASTIGMIGQACISSVENKMILTDLVNKSITK